MQASLHAATVMLPHLRRGLSDESAAKAVVHLRTLTQASAVALGDRTQVLAFDGLGDDHHAAGDALIPISAPAREDRLHVEQQIACAHDDCPLGPAVAAPLVVAGELVGSVVALYARGRRISPEDTRTVAEAAKLVSAQLELKTLEEQGERLARAELRALRAQISPHFIYNALAAIAGYIHTKPEEARELLTEFAEFTRYAFRGQRPYVTLADELQYVEKYLRLEQARWGDRLRVRVAVAPEVLQVVVPALSLQPLVENAIRHGLEAGASDGEVQIVGVDLDREVEIRVTDDGAGMTRQRAAEALAGTADGIGLVNVNRRLTSAFGASYGLQITSRPGAGTSVVMRLPKFRAGVRVA